MIRALWLLTIVAAFAGGWSIWRFERSIASGHARIQVLYDRIARDNNTLDQEKVLRSAAGDAQNDLRKIAREGSQSDAMALALQILQNTARGSGVSLIAVEPDAVPAAQASGLLRDIPITIRIRGPFPNVLRFLTHISGNAMPIEVASIRLAPASVADAKPEPVLDASIPAVVYRLAAG